MPTLKNNFARDIPCKDERTRYIDVPCGNCMECRKKYSSAWRIRLLEELKQNKYRYFVTLTFDDENLDKICKELHTNECNAVATLAVRRFCERYRKKYKVSIKHWLITELGHTNTERIHLHGVIFPNQEMTNEELQQLWKYGISDNGKYVNEATINYIVKYVTKIDNDHPEYKAVVLCSPGIGKTYINKATEKLHKYRPHRTRDYYTTPSGDRVQLPTYYRQKLYNDEEREQLWIERLDEDKKFVNGIEIRNASNNENLYFSILNTQRKINELCQYGTTQKSNKAYNVTKHVLQKAKRIEEHDVSYIDVEAIEAHRERRKQAEEHTWQKERQEYWDICHDTNGTFLASEQSEPIQPYLNVNSWNELAKKLVKKTPSANKKCT